MKIHVRSTNFKDSFENHKKGSDTWKWESQARELRYRNETTPSLDLAVCDWELSRA